jgi:putative Mn2+ efflux pump MntP
MAAFPQGLNTFATILGALVVMISGLWLVFARLKQKQQGFGPNSIKALGLVLFLPTLLVVAVSNGLQNETLAALLGTVAGYVLSHSKAEDT